MKQGHSTEHDVAFIFKRVKISIEDKVIIDNCLLDGALLKIGQVQPSMLTEKQESIRGTWNPPRINKPRIPPPPASLWKPRT
ncbi:hypothetical protein EDC96DRAFT_558340 [Choanephora cucurbitarum]|nr:hypothetical protein EDC96DRAFT_558340 [Choanephora cucurbitarum]